MEEHVDKAVSIINNVDLVLITCTIFVIIFRQQLENIASSVVLFISPKVSVGDEIKVGTIKGRVLSLGFNVTIKNKKEHYIAYIPASQLISQSIENYTLGNGQKTQIYDN